MYSHKIKNRDLYGFAQLIGVSLLLSLFTSLSNAANPCKDCTVAPIDLKISVQVPGPNNQAAVKNLPTADFLVVTWTEDETDAIALVFGCHQYYFKSQADNNFTPLIIDGLDLPHGELAHARFFKAEVNGKSVLFLKSEYHPKMSPKETAFLFKKILGKAHHPAFKYLVTSGTGGGIWSTVDLGDVVVTNKARYGLTFPDAPQHEARFAGLSDIVGEPTPDGKYTSWYDYATVEIIQRDAKTFNGLTQVHGRDPNKPKPAIYYKASATNLTDVVSNRVITDDEENKIDVYRTMGAMLDENDAYVAEICQEIGFKNWVSIRNVSDLPGHIGQYGTFGYCSSIDGGYAVWAFIMGHKTN